MRDDWFYVNQWNQNRQKVWAIVSDMGVIKEGLDRYSAESESAEMNRSSDNKSKTWVVNKYSSGYNEVKSSSRRVSNENSANQRGS